MTDIHTNTICFLPWLPLDEPIPGPHAWFIPFDATTPSTDVSQELHTTLATILSSYRHLDGRPVQRAVLVSDSAHPLLSDASDSGAARLRADIDRLAFAFLSGNEYFEPGVPHCVNAAYFQSYLQRFGKTADTVASTAAAATARTSTAASGTASSRSPFRRRRRSSRPRSPTSRSSQRCARSRPRIRRSPAASPSRSPRSSPRRPITTSCRSISSASHSRARSTRSRTPAVPR